MQDINIRDLYPSPPVKIWFLKDEKECVYAIHTLEGAATLMAVHPDWTCEAVLYMGAPITQKPYYSDAMDLHILSESIKRKLKPS